MTKHKTKTVYVAMSGGVDSSVAALLLKRQGYDVRGVYMKEWVPEGITCTSGDDRLMAARVAAHLEIPFAVWDFSKDYEREVAEYMLREYRAGRTPNPDVMCNKEIKFGLFLKQALAHGADYIATGHYVGIRNYELGIKKTRKLLQAKDSNKDQSYFLWTLTQKELQHCLFPIGDYEKPEVRAMAEKAELPSWDKKDSQGVCFVGKFDFGEFLRMQLPAKEGSIVTTSGQEVGVHDGAVFSTIGQRHGVAIRIRNKELGITDGNITPPLYVAEKNISTNTIVVATEDDPVLYKKEISVININWISGEAPELPLECAARIRYRQPLQNCRIVRQELGTGEHDIIPNSLFLIQFDVPQRAVAPGQSVVFYRGEEMLGGGIIS